MLALTWPRLVRVLSGVRCACNAMSDPRCCARPLGDIGANPPKRFDTTRVALATQMPALTMNGSLNEFPCLQVGEL